MFTPFVCYYSKDVKYTQLIQRSSHKEHKGREDQEGNLRPSVSVEVHEEGEKCKKYMWFVVEIFIF